jgi:hypothetical protein
LKLLVAAALALAPLAAAAQDPLFRQKGDAAPRAGEATKDVVRASEWPAIPADKAATVKIDIERLRKAGTPEMAEQADAALVAAGAMVAPGLIAAMGKERNVEARLRIEAVLDRVTGAEHTRLLAPYFADKSRDVRTWALARCAAFPDRELAKGAQDALGKARAALAKDEKLEGGEAELYAAALCATAAGSHEGLDVLGRTAVTEWGKKGVEIRAALAGVRDGESTKFALDMLAKDDRKQKVAALHLLAGCGTQDALAAVKRELDSTDNSIRIAAINAMRGIVDGDLPIANLPVFEAIELAKKWKERG